MRHNKKKYIYIALALLLGVLFIAASITLLIGRTAGSASVQGSTPGTGSVTTTGSGTTVQTQTGSTSAGGSKPTNSTSTGSNPTGSVPTDPTPTDPNPTDPTPTDPTPTDPTPTDPTPTDPTPTDPAPTDPAPTDPTPTDPTPTEPAPTDPTPTEPTPTEPAPTEPDGDEGNKDAYEEEGDKLEEVLGPAQITLLKPEASGVLVEENSKAIIDYSNTKDGYVMVKYLAATEKRLKVQVKGPTTTYTYNIKVGEWAVFPLSDGNGEYTIKVYENVKENQYGTRLSLTCDVKLEDEFAPFLRPNQYVNYTNATNTMNKAASLLNNKMTVLEKVATIYDYVINNLSYDYAKAENIQSDYLPDLDAVLKSKKGICFDYAALMTAMLRSQNIPCKLVVGYADTTYHAWISVWSPETGWVDGAIFFNGVNWKHMDPTYASGGMDIDSVNYSSKYIY